MGAFGKIHFKKPKIHIKKPKLHINISKKTISKIDKHNVITTQPVKIKESVHAAVKHVTKKPIDEVYKLKHKAIVSGDVVKHVSNQSVNKITTTYTKEVQPTLVGISGGLQNISKGLDAIFKFLGSGNVWIIAILIVIIYLFINM